MWIWAVLPLFLLWPLQRDGVQPTSTVQRDVDRLVHAAGQQSGSWPLQPPPPVPEVATVARHGIAAVPFLMPLLSDDADPKRDARRWRVQQQDRRARFGEGAPVAEAARRAIAVISQ